VVRLREDELETLTILVTDVEGSTELRGRFGDQIADEILALHEDIVRRNITANAGREVVFLGDGMLAAFPTPPDAVRAAIGIQRELDQYSRANPARKVRVRIGIHEGEVTEREGRMYGQAVHAAARVMAQGSGGEILASLGTRDAATSEARFEDRGLFWLKGFPERWRLYEVEWREGEDAADAPGPAGRTRLIERDPERADLRRKVQAALGGEGRLVLVSGEAGVGKTRLLLEVDAEAQAKGMRVLAGHALEAEGARTAYLPFVEILESALTSSRSTLEVREALGDAAAEISRIVPTLRRLFPDIAPPLELPPEQARRYLWVSLEEFLERATRDRPLLLVLEDLHWADESTVLLLEYLAPRIANMPVLIVGTFRDDEVGPAHPLTRVMNQLARDRAVDRIRLGRLSLAGVAAMVEALSGQEPPELLVRAIHGESEGNPFFTEEVYLHLAESGRLFDEGGRFRRSLTVEDIDVPESVRAVVGRRVARLSEPARDVLAAAAVSGRVFEPSVVGQVAGSAQATLADALDEAERAQLVAPRNGGGRWVFQHELIRQTLLAETSTMKRQLLHARTAEAIEAAHGDDLDEHAAELAYHFSRSGSPADPLRSVLYMKVAGDRSMQASAFDDGLARYEEALALVGDNKAVRAALLERQAMALRSVQRWDDALRAMDASLNLYEEVGDVEAVGRICWAMVYQLGWAARFEEAVLVAGRGLAALGETASPDRARLLAAGGWIFGLGGDYATATEMFWQAMVLIEQLDDDRALADVLHLKTIYHMSYIQFDEGIESGLQAAEVFEREGALWDWCSALSFVVYQAGAAGDQEMARTYAQRIEALAERLGHLGVTFLILADRMRREAVMRGDLDSLEKLALRSIEVCERGQLPWIYVGHLYLGLAAHWRGDADTAEKEFRTAAALEPPAAFSGASPSLLALHLAHEGRADEVMQLYEDHRESLPTLGQVNSLGSYNFVTGGSEALYLIGRNEEAAALLPLLEEGLERGIDWITFDASFLKTRAAIAAAAAGRWDKAEIYYRESLERSEEMGNRIEAADVRRLWAKMLLDRNDAGDRERAADLLKLAAESYRDMDMRWLAETSESLLADSR
jgi:class 3 adenylate cyclase/tetratricopeptide (TPR) repeat protein